MNRKTIITCAVTGNLTKKEQHPGLPITPSEIAASALEAADAGAAIVHLHARDPQTGLGCMNLDTYIEIVERIEKCNREVIINLTTGEGGRFVPSPGEPRVAGPGTTLATPLARTAHISKIRPEICTLDLNTMWSGQAAVVNSPQSVADMAEQIYAANTLPEIEIFDSGDIALLHDLIARKIIKTPVMVQLVLGVRFGAQATPDTMMYLVRQLPANAIWSAFGIGRMEFPMVAQSYLLGGHVRVGMEDNLHIAKGRLTKGNGELVERAKTIVQSLGGEIASPQEAREMLSITAAQ